MRRPARQFLFTHYGFNGCFTPEAQDLAAIRLLSGRGAVALIKAGRIAPAVA